jgi:hypothetical protein
VSDTVLSVIPTDPRWQPEKAAVERATALAAKLVPDDGMLEIKATWHERITAIDCGENLSRITCPSCGGVIELEWYSDLLEHKCGSGFDTLSVTVPCCGAATTLDALRYDWPCGFARFEIEIWNPERDWFTDDELADFATALGHPVRQVLAHL